MEYVIMSVDPRGLYVIRRGLMIVHFVAKTLVNIWRLWFLKQTSPFYMPSGKAAEWTN